MADVDSYISIDGKYIATNPVDYFSPNGRIPVETTEFLNQGTIFILGDLNIPPDDKYYNQSGWPEDNNKIPGDITGFLDREANFPFFGSMKVLISSDESAFGVFTFLGSGRYGYTYRVYNGIYYNGFWHLAVSNGFIATDSDLEKAKQSFQYKLNNYENTFIVSHPTDSTSSTRLAILLGTYLTFSSGEYAIEISSALFGAKYISEQDEWFEYNRSLWKAGKVPPVAPPYNPYQPGGPSGPYDPSVPGFIPGTFDEKSDPIPDSPLPTLSAANTGFTRIYNPSLSQVQDLARYLWTDESLVTTLWNKLKQFFEDPMQAIIGFNLVPVAVPNGGTEEFKILYIPTGINMTVAANQFVDVDCGTVKLERFYGSALDQSPYTKVSCYLPYIGTVQLNTDEVMGSTLQVKYRVDIVSGSCVAKILIEGNVLYQYSGHCAITIPFASADFSAYVTAAISVAKLAVGAVAGGVPGALAAAASVNPAQETNQVVTTKRIETETARNPSTGRQVTTGTRTTVETIESPVDTSSTQASFDYLSPANIANTVGQIMGSKPQVEHSGSFSGNSGYLGIRRPFLIIERPNMCMPEQYQHFNGFPAMITMDLSACKGFTRIQQVQLTGLGATNPEQSEILGLLKSGVYF